MTDLSDTEPFERLAWAREQAGFATATDAARAFGWNENTYRSHENGERGIRRKVAEIYATAFKVDLSFILIGHKYNAPTQYVPIVGALKDGGVVEFVGDYDNFQHNCVASLPFDALKKMIAIEVSENTYMGCFQPRDLLLFHQDPYFRYIFGQYYLISTEANEYFVRILEKGKGQSTYDLLLPTSRTIRDVKVDTGKLLSVIIPGSQWSKRDASTGEVVKRDWERS